VKKLKVCSNCLHANYSGSIYGFAEKQNTTPDKLNIVFCYEEQTRHFKQKWFSCDKFLDRGDKLLE
jgi:hypothetical protein